MTKKIPLLPPLSMEEIVALLIQIRCYSIRPHAKPVYDSLAWQRLNTTFGNNVNYTDEQLWLEHYLATHSKSVADTGPIFAHEHPELQTNVSLLEALIGNLEAAAKFTLDGTVVVQRRGIGYLVMHPVDKDVFVNTSDAQKNYNLLVEWLTACDNTISMEDGWTAITEETDLPWEWRSTPQQQIQSKYAQLTKTTSAAIAQLYELKDAITGSSSEEQFLRATFAQTERDIRSLHYRLMDVENRMRDYAKQGDK